MHEMGCAISTLGPRGDQHILCSLINLRTTVYCSMEYKFLIFLVVFYFDLFYR